MIISKIKKFLLSPEKVIATFLGVGIIIIIYCFYNIITEVSKQEAIRQEKCRQITSAKMDVGARFTSSNGMSCDVVKLTSPDNCFVATDIITICK